MQLPKLQKFDPNKPKKKKIINPASMYYINNEGKVIFVDEEE